MKRECMAGASVDSSDEAENAQPFGQYVSFAAHLSQKVKNERLRNMEATCMFCTVTPLQP